MSSLVYEFSHEKCQAYGYTWYKIQCEPKITLSCHYQLIIGVFWCFFLFELSFGDIFEPIIIIRDPLFWLFAGNKPVRELTPTLIVLGNKNQSEASWHHGNQALWADSIKGPRLWEGVGMIQGTSFLFKWCFESWLN